MTPELRAIADRFIYEQATLKHIAALAPEDALNRNVPGQAWTVRQLLAHLATSLQNYDRIVRRWLAGEPPLEGWDPDHLNAATAEQYKAATVAQLFEVFGRGLNGLFASLSAIPDEKLPEPLGTSDALTTLRGFGDHAVGHAIALADALPEVRFDPLVLNWLLGAEFEDEESQAWQRQLLAEAREYIASLPEHEDEEDEDEE